MFHDFIFVERYSQLNVIQCLLCITSIVDLMTITIMPILNE